MSSAEYKDKKSNLIIEVKRKSVKISINHSGSPACILVPKSKFTQLLKNKISCIRTKQGVFEIVKMESCYWFGISLKKLVKAIVIGIPQDKFEDLVQAFK